MRKSSPTRTTSRPAPSYGSLHLPAQERPKRIIFLLLERFTLMAFTSACEPLRLANQIAGQKLYEWVLASENGTTATSSGLIDLKVDIGLQELGRDDIIIVCGGIDVSKATTQPILNWLRREGRRGCVLAGICTGTWTLAQAGLLDGRRATVHWEIHDAFSEDFDSVDLVKSVYVFDGNRLSAAGGTATLDLMLRMIAGDHGEAIAGTVADQLVHTAIRSENDSLRLSIPTRIGVRHPKLAQVIGRMEANIEDPISPALLATEVGMSTRQLERLFRRYLNRSPKRYYMELRLQKARSLLMQTEMSIINVALACGFASPSHFSKCYREHYQTTPYRERGTKSDGQPLREPASVLTDDLPVEFFPLDEGIEDDDLI
ncbi:GlxA family transcriptional regulator [Rhodobacteraceae bacterium]|nr:GlxA family transcriptional regulator [Paracoccaceae bacterium]